MKSVLTFTTTISPALMLWLNEYSKEKKITKRLVIEQALKIYKNNIMKKELEESFKRASQDEEIIKMSEENMDDYTEQLKRLHI